MSNGASNKPTVRGVLALFLVLGVIPGLWIIEGLDLVNMPDAVIGATILQWGLMLQYYFRKKGSNEETS